MFAYCNNNPINLVDPTGYAPRWLSTSLSFLAGVAIIAAGVMLASATFGAAAPLTVMITATAIGAVGGSATNAAMQYSETKSWDNFDIYECVSAGVAGGFSATLATTPVGIGGQIIGNATIAGVNSFTNGNSGWDLVSDVCLGGFAGWAGGPGAGRGGFVLSEALRNKQLLTSFMKGYAKSSVVGNTRNIASVAKRLVSRLSE